MRTLQAKLAILVVEDHIESLMILARLLKKDGHIVHTADGYQTALDVATRERIDLAVCDIALWDGNGCELLKELQKLHKLKAIAVTGFALADEVAHYRRSGFAAVLPKPLDHSQLTFAISQLVSAQANERTTEMTGIERLPTEPGQSRSDFSTRP